MDRFVKILEDNSAQPVTCEIDPSNKCPLDCSFCMYKDFLDKDRTDLDWDIYCDLIDSLRIDNCKSITFTGGGEPLMHPKINDMVRVAANWGFQIGLITNAVMLSVLDRPELFKFIRISLDAGSREVYRKVKGKDKFDQVVKNIKGLMKVIDTEQTTVGLSFVVTKDNYQDVEAATDLCDELGCSYIQFKPDVTDDSYYKRIMSVNGQSIKTDRYQADTDLPCKIAGLIGVVSANGKVYYCCQKRGDESYCLGDLRDGDFSYIWHSRFNVKPSFEECPPCRYMNYAKGVEGFIEGADLFYKHRNFM